MGNLWRGSGTETPPPTLPRRLPGLLFIFCDPYCQRSVLSAWRDAEERFIAWVEAHADPKPRWLRKAGRLRALHQSEDRWG